MIMTRFGGVLYWACRATVLPAALMSLVLAACYVLPAVQEPTTLYSLAPKTTYPPDLPEVKWQLVVELPTAAAGIDSSRIALSQDPFALEYYAKAAWTDNAPGMIQSLLVESFERTGKILAVGPESAGLRPDYILQSDLRTFQANYRSDDPVPTVLVRMTAKLIAMPQRRIVGAMTSQEFAKARSGKLEDVLDAFNDAGGHVFRDIVVYTLKTLASAGTTTTSAAGPAEATILP